MGWKSLECHPPRMGKLARCSDIPAAVWLTPKWPQWTTAAPPSGSASIPQCLWKVSCESDLSFFLSFFFWLHLCLTSSPLRSCDVHQQPWLFVRMFVSVSPSSTAVGTTERSAGQTRSLCSGCVRRPATWWGTARPARTTTPSRLSKLHALLRYQWHSCTA